MDTPVTLRKIQKIVAEQLGLHDNEVKPESTLYDALWADSLDMIEIVMAVEEEFALNDSIPDEEIEKFKTVQDIANYVEEQKQ